jgi:hypothetical protein
VDLLDRPCPRRAGQQANSSARARFVRGMDWNTRPRPVGDPRKSQAGRGASVLLPWNTHPDWFGQPVPGGRTGAARAPVPILRSRAVNIAASASVGEAAGVGPPPRFEAPVTEARQRNRQPRKRSSVGSRRPELGAWLACGICCYPVDCRSVIFTYKF